MGRLTYGSATAPIDVDDAILAHVRAVTFTKLRRNESFALTIPTSGGSVETLWIQAAIPLRFVLDADTPLDRAVLVSMMNAASSSAGLDLTRDEFAALRDGKPVLHAMSA